MGCASETSVDGLVPSWHACARAPFWQVNPEALRAVQTACKVLNVRNVDLWGNLLVRHDVQWQQAWSG